MMDGYQKGVRGDEIDGYYSVGDVASLDRNGFLRIVDRKKDMIISGGVNISPAEVESALLGHEAVFDAAVVGIPDEDFGEAVMAFVVLQNGASADEKGLIEFCKKRMSKAKCPKKISFLEAIPRSPQGKIDKKALREPFWRDVGRSI